MRKTRLMGEVVEENLPSRKVVDAIDAYMMGHAHPANPVVVLLLEFMVGIKERGVFKSSGNSESDGH